MTTQSGFTSLTGFEARLKTISDSYESGYLALAAELKGAREAATEPHWGQFTKRYLTVGATHQKGLEALHGDVLTSLSTLPEGAERAALAGFAEAVANKFHYAAVVVATEDGPGLIWAEDVLAREDG